MAKNPQFKNNKSNQPDIRNIDPENPEENTDTSTGTDKTTGTIEDTSVTNPTDTENTETSENGDTNEDTQQGNGGDTTPPETTEPVIPPQEPTDPSEPPVDPTVPDDSAIPTTKPSDADGDPIGKEIGTINDALLRYGKLMSGKRAYSRVEGPSNQVLIINILENIFVDTLDYTTMEAKIRFFFRFAANLAKTDDNWLGVPLAYRGLDSVKLPFERVENYSRLLNMVIRINEARNKKEELALISFDFTFKYHPKPVTAEYAKSIVTDICNG